MGQSGLEAERPELVGLATGVVVEIGIGSGYNLPFYKNITKLYGVDPSQELFELGKERLEKFTHPFEFLKVSAEKIPLADNSVDTVVSTWSLCSISHLDFALREAYRILKPGGKFIFIEHGKSDRKFIVRTQKILNPIWTTLSGGCHLDREIDTYIKVAGFHFEKLDKTHIPGEAIYFEYKGIAVK